ncbi:metallophosphoesterase [uncultured Thiohalocapsa sp.]|uniref:metallophosphoesterase n=1 Tax=uncultured Thiohalocapsa sp. TaxID=768990 RepID=UPI0025D97171|nr:metallophosphoesterase [uncultured Thiohalocapsa sp.]
MADTDAPAPRTGGSGRCGQNAAVPFRLLQLTDLHLYADPERRLLGQNTRRTLESVLSLAQTRHWPPDAIVLTGDLVHDEQPAAYRFLRSRFDGLGIPYHCIPGNHDRLDLLVGHLDRSAASALRLVPAGAWDLLLLDSTVPAEEGGHLDERVLAGLAAHAAADRRRPTLVFLHHHLAPLGSRWIDTMQVDNGPAALAALASHPDLSAVICGHVHQDAEQRQAGLRLLATPSTCVQFLPGSRDFALDPLTPGYRWLELHPDGRLDTGVERTDAYPEPFTPATEGY